VLDESTANSIHTKLDNGKDFATLAKQYDPVTGGELGWFPRGFLTQPEVDEAAFALQPGQYSAVVHSAIGYHIIQVIERDPNHPLSPEARRAMQQKALQDWLQQQRSASQIEVLLP
jgi:peptidyl-prolyl cis-trans isomerase C